MMKRFVLFAASLFLHPFILFAQENDAANRELESYVDTVQQAGEGMTLWQVLQSGGIVMIILGILSLIMITLVFFLFLRLSATRLVPMDQTERVVEQLEQKRYREALEECLGSETIVANIAVSGLNQMKHGLTTTKEAVELTARREVTALWSSLNHLTDIAQVAPMLGLLGTVLGMIQAFNTIAFEAAVVKPILLAGGVSKAMVTTAAGLVVAIIAMLFYSLLRSRVQNITSMVETATSRLLEAFRQ